MVRVALRASMTVVGLVAHRLQFAALRKFQDLND